MALKKWQLKATVYGLLIAAVPVRHSGEIHLFAGMMLKMLTGSLS